MKTEPQAFSIDDLKRLGKDAWSGVRNYQARNFMKDMCVGDKILFYHSSASPAGIAGLAKVVSAAHSDETQFDKTGRYFDHKATRKQLIWYCVDVRFVKKFPQIIALEELRGRRALKDMVLLRRGSRLSVQPVTKEEYDAIINH